MELSEVYSWSYKFSWLLSHCILGDHGDRYFIFIVVVVIVALKPS